MRCETCGSTLRAGYCTNCQEELYILEQQTEHMEHPVSDEFLKKALLQRQDPPED